MVHALDLEEIRWRVGLFLSSQDLAACSQVCRVWSSTFWPMQWRHVTLDRNKANTRTPTIQDLDPCASLIRSFTFKGCIPKEIVPFLVNKLQSNQIGPLVSLSFMNATTTWRLDYWNLVVQLATLSSSALQELCIRNTAFYVSHDMLQQLFVGHQLENDKVCKIQWRALRHLTLSFYGIVELETWNTMLEIFQHLESLELDRLQLNSSVSQHLESIYNTGRKQPRTTAALDQQKQQQTQEQVRFPHLKWLKLTQLRTISTRMCLNVLVAQCPSLQGLCWTICKKRGFPTREFYRLLKAGTWPRLEALEIYGDLIQIPDHLLAAILSVDSTTAGKQAPFRKLCVPRSMFGSMAMVALLSPTRGHITTLRELDLSECNRVSSRIVGDILASCPHLEVFSARNIENL